MKPLKSVDQSQVWTRPAWSGDSATQSILQGYADWIASQPSDESRYLCFIVTTMDFQRYLVSFGQGRLDLQEAQLAGRGLQYFSDRLFKVPTLSAECFEMCPDHPLDSQNVEGLQIQIDPTHAQAYLSFPSLNTTALTVDLEYSRDSNLFQGFAQTTPKTLFAIALKRKVVLRGHLNQ
jgi:hypothetical protein